MVEGAPERHDAPSSDSLEAVHAPILQFFPDEVMQLGGDPARLLDQVGLGAPDAACPPQGANYRRTAELLELSAKALDRPDFGMRLARRHCAAGPLGTLGHAMRHSRRFGEALDVAARHGYAHSLSAGIWLRRSPSGASIIMGHEILLDRLPAKAQVMEMILLCGHLSAMWLTGGLVRARRIYFRHQPVSSIAAYRAYFGCEVRFGQHVNATLYHDVDLARPIAVADEPALRSAISQIETRFPRRQPPLSLLARGVIMHLVGTDRCTAEWTAERLRLHLRTLHRRLDEEGTCFRRLKDEVRRDMLAYYLAETELEVSEISERLGLSEQSVLTRCCRRWFGESPTQLRARSRRAGAGPAPAAGNHAMTMEDVAIVGARGRGPAAALRNDGRR